MPNLRVPALCGTLLASLTLAAVRSFLARRDSFDAEARRRLATQLHAALAPKVGGADERDPERFLETLAAAKAAREGR